MHIQPNAAFLQQLMATFLMEAREHVQMLGVSLLDIEHSTSEDAQRSLIERLFREAHCLKGAARAVNAREIERLCQTLEGTSADIKSGKSQLSTETLDGLHRAVTRVGQLLDALETPQPEKPQPEIPQPEKLQPEIPQPEIPQPEIPQPERPQPEKLQPEKLQPEKLQPERPQPERPQPERPQPEKLQPEKLQPEKLQPEKLPPERLQPERLQPERLQPEIPQPETPRQQALGVVSKEQAASTGGHKPILATHNRHEGGDTVRIATNKLDAIFVHAEALLGVKLALAERAFEIKALAGLWTERDRLRNETQPLLRNLRQQVEARMLVPDGGTDAGGGQLELAARLLDFLDQDQEHAETLNTRIADLTRNIGHDRRHLDTMTDRLLDDVKKALMLPFETVLAGFPKMVRDMACDVGKKIEFHMSGTDIEIDKRILETIKDPLLHLVRNSIDHGIETPAERTRCGKPPCGSVSITITQAGGKVEIAVSDDGTGIDLATVREAALNAGVITADEAATLANQDIPQLVFRSGVTTRPQVTTISGRGLGMAIVEEHVAKLSGTVSIESSHGVGTTVKIGLPLTMATLRGTVVTAAHREFVIPTANVIRAVRCRRDAIRRVENRDSICLDGTTLSLVRLTDVLGLVSGQTAGGGTAMLTILVLGYGNMSIAFAVDQVIGEQEVLSKPLGRLLLRVRNVAGATVFGTGRIVPILSVPDLLQSAIGWARTNGMEPGLEWVLETHRVKKLLVVDDSITARTLLQNILETSGYSIKTATDGANAFTALQTEPFDLLVSDVEMPGMDGFELTKRVRADPQLRGLPVVLVTALEARNDRERGLNAGANAYIVKSGFDQSHLLEVIDKLI